VNVISIEAEPPGRSTAVLRLPRAKSCPTTPLLTTMKRTRPTGTIRRDREKPKSLATTRTTITGAFADGPDPEEDAA
jgi:hypothetical protein